MKKLFIIILYPFLLFSQGEYLNDNISGIAAGASYSANKLLEGNSVAAGFSILSKVDIGFEYANFHSKASLNRNYKVSGKLIYAAYNSKRKNNRTNLKVLLGYTQTDVNQVFGYSSKNKSSGVVVSLGFSVRLYDGETLKIMPGINLTYSFLSKDEVFSNYYYNSSSRYIDHSRSLGLDFNAIFRLSRDVNLVLTPFLSKDLLNTKDPTLTGIGASFVIELQN